MNSAVGTAMGGAGVAVPVVPVLRSPFPSRVNPYSGQAEQQALRWARRLGLVRSHDLAALAGQRFGHLAGRCHPELAPAPLSDVCRWYVWFALLDDRYCDRGAPAEDQLARRLALLSRVLADGVADEPDPLAVAAADLSRRTRRRATAEQYRRLVLGFQATFFGLLWERAAREPSATPGTVEYLGMRPYTGALPAFVTLTEIFSGRPPLPQDVARPEAQALVTRVGNLIMWQNDICSYPWEAASGRPVLSLPTVLEQGGAVSSALALERAAQMWSAEVDRYRQARADVLGLGVPALRRYADRLEDLLAGFLTWHYETARYR